MACLCLSLGGGPFGAGGPYGQSVDPEEILRTFFGGRDSPFGFRSASGGFEDFSQAQQVIGFF